MGSIWTLLFMTKTVWSSKGLFLTFVQCIFIPFPNIHKPIHLSFLLRNKNTSPLTISSKSVKVTFHIVFILLLSIMSLFSRISKIPSILPLGFGYQRLFFMGVLYMCVRHFVSLASFPRLELNTYLFPLGNFKRVLIFHSLCSSMPWRLQHNH